MFRIYNDYSSIIKNIDQLKVWNYIIGYPVSLRQKIYNPLRPDKHPTCYLYEKDGYILLADWANREYHGLGAVKALQIKDNLTYSETLTKLNHSSFQLPSSNIYQINFKKRKDFQFRLEFELKNYTYCDKQYWSQYGITTAMLVKENIRSVNYYFCNSQNYPDRMVQRKADKLAFRITMNNRSKLYQPLSEVEKGKFLTNFNEFDIWGKVEKKSRILIITKSFKDYMVLKYHTSYNVQVVPSESVHLNSFYIDVINDNYDHIYPLMDNDSTGIAASKRFEKQIGKKAKGLVMPECNDPAEYYKKHGNIDIIKTMINDTTNYTQVLASNNRKVFSG
jgi:hypothetical protein